MKETFEQLNEQMDYITRIFEDGKIGSVIYNSYYLVHQIATDALQQLTEKDATIQREYALKHEAYNNLTRCHETMADNAEEITRLRKSLEEIAGWDGEYSAQTAKVMVELAKQTLENSPLVRLHLGEGDNP